MDLGIDLTNFAGKRQDIPALQLFQMASGIKQRLLCAALLALAPGKVRLSAHDAEQQPKPGSGRYRDR
jgi:hypothetical protein